MINNQWTEQEEWKLAEFLVQQVCDRASGRTENECLRNYPRDVYFVGNLRPQPAEEDDLGRGELLSKLAPVAFGAEFRLQPETNEIKIAITLSWTCYYRVFPTLEQQRTHQRQRFRATGSTDYPQVLEDPQSYTEQSTKASASEPIDNPRLSVDDEQETQQGDAGSFEVTESPIDRRRTRTPRDSLFISFRKIDCRVQGYVVLRSKGFGKWETDVSDLQTVLDQEVERVQAVAMQDPDRIRTATSQEVQVRVPETELSSVARYTAFLQSLKTEVVPKWGWQVKSEVRPDEIPEYCNVLVEFINCSPTRENCPNSEAFLFNTHAVFSFSGVRVLPFELEVVPRGFRYDRNLWGRGFNCAVERVDTLPHMYITTHTPVYRQMRYQTRVTPSASFADLERDPVPTLEAILRAMEAYLQIWDQERQAYINDDANWEQRFDAEFDRDRQKFTQEIELFRRSLQIIVDNADVQTAFKLTNETFRRSDPRKTAWRLFQIVFLVCQIPGIVALREPEGASAVEREYVDIIYFPTGGGKTEAYLATLVFHCFFDRLRGKSAGVTAWTRFPLRLLTLQQTQRLADIIGMAELVRREQIDLRLSGSDVDGFAVGYFVGAEATPNEITPPRPGATPDPVWSQANDPNARQRWKRVVRCPSCRTTTVQVDFDPVTVTLSIDALGILVHLPTD